MAKHSGGCHCGSVHYEVTTDLGMVLACNCSICQKRGALWTYVGPDEFKLLSGEDELTDYQFNKKVIHHLLPNLRSRSFSKGQNEDGSEGFGINVRCLDDVDIETLTLTPYGGKTL